jgi:hypothetical protein
MKVCESGSGLMTDLMVGLAFVKAFFVINTQRRINISGNLTKYFQDWEGSPARVFCAGTA